MSEYYKAETIAARHLVMSAAGGTATEIELIADLEVILEIEDELEVELNE